MDFITITPAKSVKLELIGEAVINGVKAYEFKGSDGNHYFSQELPKPKKTNSKPKAKKPAAKK